jgi:glycosyltransferase involved in cell wall biosynthesis
MNILVLNYEFPPLGGGASQVSFEIAKRYVEKGNQVDVVTMGFKDLPAFEVVNGVRVFRVKAIRKKKETCETHEMLSYIISAILFIRKNLDVQKYDICHCHFLIPTGLVALYLKKKFQLNYIVTIHGSDVPGFNPDRFTFEHFFTSPILKWVSKNAKMVCSPSHYLQELAAQEIGITNIIHIPNGIDLEEFKLDFSKPKEPMILSTGRLLERKGFQTLLRAVKGIALPYEVHIVGDGPYREQLEALAVGSKTKIVFHGWVEKGSQALMDLYERAAIYVLASAKENASIALLEGMAAKCVMITTNVSGCPETVGGAGFLIDFDDHEALQDKLLELIHDPKKIVEYSQRSYKRLIENYLWEESVKKYLSVLASK